MWYWLAASIWYLVEGDIKRGYEVTFDGQMSFESPNPKAFWGKVFLGSCNGVYIGEEKKGALHKCGHK